jgi:hypothetical protein
MLDLSGAKLEKPDSGRLAVFDMREELRRRAGLTIAGLGPGLAVGVGEYASSMRIAVGR